MRLFETPLDRLSARDREAWRRLAHQDGALISPYLLPEFADAVQAERGDVHVIIAEDRGGPAGFFAYHAPLHGVARPAGAPLSDYQGFAGRADLDIDEAELLNAMGAEALVFDNWVGPALGQVRARAGSAVIDLSNGPEAWLETRASLFKDHFKKMRQRRRKAEREFGEIRVIFGDPFGERYEALKAWKSAQYRQSGLLDLFDVDWTEGLMSRCSARAFGPFRGLTASLYFGDELAAVEMGIAAGGVYHSWMPAYDARFASVSPGLLLLHAIIEKAGSLGLTRIDLGKGEQPYKKYYTDFEIPLAGGRVLRRNQPAVKVAAWDAAEWVGARLPGPLAQAPMKLRRRWAQTAAVETTLPGRLKRMADAVMAAPKRLGVAG